MCTNGDPRAVLNFLKSNESFSKFPATVEHGLRVLIPYVCNLLNSTGGQARHMKSVKIGVALFIVFVGGFIPPLYALNFGGPINGYLRYSIFASFVANFFIYLVY